MAGQETFFKGCQRFLLARLPITDLVKKAGIFPSPTGRRRYSIHLGQPEEAVWVRGCKLSSGSSRIPPPLRALPSRRSWGCRCRWRSRPADSRPGAARCGRPAESRGGCRSPPPELEALRPGGRARSGAGTQLRVESPRGCRSGRPCSLRVGTERQARRDARRAEPPAGRRSAEEWERRGGLGTPSGQVQPRPAWPLRGSRSRRCA